MKHFVLPLLFLSAGAVGADAPVPVQQDRYHKNIFENAWLRIINVEIPVGQMTQYHTHELPSVIVYLTKSINRSQTWGETTTTPRETTPGDARYAAYDEKPLSHQVTNPGPARFHVFDVELLKPPGATASAALVQPHVKLRWDEKRVRVYNVNLASSEHSEVTVTGAGQLIIGISGTVMATAGVGPKRELRNSDYVFFPAGTRYRLAHASGENAEVVLLELK